MGNTVTSLSGVGEGARARNLPKLLKALRRAKDEWVKRGVPGGAKGSWAVLWGAPSKEGGCRRVPRVYAGASKSARYKPSRRSQALLANPDRLPIPQKSWLPITRPSALPSRSHPRLALCRGSSRRGVQFVARTLARNPRYLLRREPKYSALSTTVWHEAASNPRVGGELIDVLEAALRAWVPTFTAKQVRLRVVCGWGRWHGSVGWGGVGVGGLWIPTPPKPRPSTSPPSAKDIWAETLSWAPLRPVLLVGVGR